MARRMRALDWSKTALGPVERWPLPLRTSISTALRCAFPLFVWWGPELTLLYNDEYAAMLGSKHPTALGQPGAKVWAEIWDVIGPMLAQVRERGEATRSRDLLLYVDRGYLEEAYFSFSYSPIDDEHGRVAGVYCPVIETTDKVIGERRLRTLRDLAAKLKRAEGEQATYEAAAAVLARNVEDVPFALIYRVDAQAGSAALQVAVGMEAHAAAAPEHVTLGECGEDRWGLDEVARSGEMRVVTRLADHFGSLPTSARKLAPHSAVVSPVLLPGDVRPTALLVTAVSPVRALDDNYRTFFSLIATQLASGLADARALEAERKRSEALAELDRAKIAFFSNVSHEFRTPITLMLGPLEELLATHTLPEDTRATLQVVQRNSLRLLKLVNTLLDFARLEAGRMQAQYEATDLSAWTLEIASGFRSAIEAAGLTFHVECQPLPERVYVDRDMWEKIVLNLLSNAFKFTFEGSIALELRWHSDHVELTVRDTGVGIPESELPQLFQRFHRARNTRGRTYEGTGIGLALIQELARLHGGTVALNSQEGRGTSARVQIRTGRAHLPEERITDERREPALSASVLPFVEEARRWEPAVESAHAIAGEPLASPEGEARVLVADDNADMREYLERLLGQHYRVETVSDGRSALQRIESTCPDLVLCDVMMPVLDGFGLLAAIRAHPHERTRSLPFVLLSARAGEESRIEGLRAGADDYLVKPFGARELLARVDSQLALARLRRQTDLQLAESERRLREADKRKDEFIALLAHELRNPLAPIRTGLEVLRRADDASETHRRVRAMMERQVSQMVRLIDDLLDVSRITSGKILLQREPTRLDELTLGVIEAHRDAIATSQLELRIDLQDAACVVDVDPARLSQVLSNLIHNAVKFTPAQGQIRIAARLRTLAGSARDEVDISVSDTGIGIPSDMLSRIFELFTQGEQPLERSRGGLGLGLALARQLTEMHGGTVTAESGGAGRGSTFVVTLPVSHARIETPAEPRPLGPVERRVLIIDDNEDAADTLAMLVARMGGVARTENEALSGIAAIAAFAPQIILLDIGLPTIDGYEACRRIRALHPERELQIIALTGWGQQQDKAHAFAAGFDLHWTKPVDAAVLENLLRGSGEA